MKYLVFLALLIQLFTINAQQEDDIIGTYHLPNNLDVEIYRTGDDFSGKIVSVEGFNDGHFLDYKNPDKLLRSDSLLGKEIITELKYDKASKQWLNGKMYGPGKGLIFNLKVNEVLDNEIEVVGSKFFFWKTMKWSKI